MCMGPRVQDDDCLVGLAVVKNDKLEDMDERLVPTRAQNHCMTRLRQTYQASQPAPID